MEFKQIQELIKAINKSNIGEVSIEDKDFKLTIKQKKDNVQTFVNAVPLPAAQPQYLPQAPATAAPVATAAAPAEEAQPDNLVAIKSPMIGTFYRRVSPDKPYLTDVGSDIKAGQTVCIIEAMKLFNEIESEVSGRIVKVLVEDSSPVEYDQPLFLVEPA